MQPDLLALLPPLQEIILEAGDTVMKIYNSDFEVYGKVDKSPVTEADRKAEKIIEKSLSAIAPDIPIVGEEAKAEGKCPDISGGLFWLVDPLDGTKEFIKKGTDFTVNIGLIRNGHPILGLVLAPAVNKLYWGIVGKGAWTANIVDGKISETKAISARATDPNKLVIVASKSHRSSELETWLSNFPKADNVSIGSSLKLCLLATGEADLYPRLGPTCEWDTAAAHAVLLSAGGVVEIADGSPLTYGKDLTTFLNPWFLCRGDKAFPTPGLG